MAAGIRTFDPFAFAPVTEVRFGSSGFNRLRLPGVKNWDLSLFRRISLGGHRNLQIRAEWFNVTNTPQFNNPARTCPACS